MNYNCNTCNKEITKEPNGEERKFEWWKRPDRVYEITIHLELLENFLLPKLDKHPTEYDKLKTALHKCKSLNKELVEPNHEKIEETSWKFFYKKGKLFPPFKISGKGSSRDEMCDSCYSELETQLKPNDLDEIELEKIGKRFEELNFNEEEFTSKLSKNEKSEMGEEETKLFKQFLENKEKELNNKITTERERERERAKMARVPIENLELSVVV